MRYLFPETKFVRENSSLAQINHVLSEVREFMDAEWNTAEEKEEAVDIYHSLETLFRIWEKEGADMEAVMQKVFEKNRARDYYEETEE